MKIENIQRLDREPKVASFDVNFDKIGFVVSCELVKTKAGGFFVALPQKSFKDESGAWKNQPLCRWDSAERSKGFSSWCIEQLKLKAGYLFEAKTEEPQDDFNDDNLPF